MRVKKAGAATMIPPLLQEKLDNLKADMFSKPLLGVTFSTRKSEYYYDTVSSEIIRTSPFMKSLIEALLRKTKASRLRALTEVARKHSEEKVLKGLKAIIDKQQNDNILKQFSGDFELSLNHQYQNRRANLSSMVLEITQNCNFRCSYCMYGDNYSNKRKHSKISMKKDVALQAIKYFLDNCGSENPIITFFGGEPFLFPNLIEECMEYARGINPDTKFTITTNGYLLKPPHFDFIRKFQVRVSISFDGPKAIHNSHRILSGGGETFDTIMKNIKDLFYIDADYVKENFMLFLTLTDIENLGKLSLFLGENQILNELPVSINKITIRGLKENVNEFTRTLPGDTYLNKLVNEYIDSYQGDKKKLVKAHNAYFFPQIKLVSVRFPIEKSYKLCKVCTIGDKRLFVDVNGDFRVCEKSHDLPIIGDINQGLNWDAVDRMKHEFLSTTNPCKQCWAVGLCNVCWVDIYDNNGQVNKNLKEDICKIRLAEYSIALRVFMELTELLGDNIFPKASS
jgi:uncharacterized protein